MNTIKINRIVQVCLLTISLTGFAASDQPLQSYVQRLVPLDATAIQLQQVVEVKQKACNDNAVVEAQLGEIVLSTTEQVKSAKPVCEQYICGYNQQEVCSDVRQEQVPKVDTQGKEQEQGYSKDKYVKQCHMENTTAKYCERNCHDVFEEQVVPATSPIIATIRGLTCCNKFDKTAKIFGLWLGVNTTPLYSRALYEAANAPDGYFWLQKEKHGFLLQSLNPMDTHVIVMNARGYKLVEGQSFLTAPERAGDPLRLTITVEPANASYSDYSATSIDAPALALY